jgi:pentatricopeptide repeat domain-containing protein 1
MTSSYRPFLSKIVQNNRRMFVTNQIPEPANENTRDLIAAQDGDTFGTLSVNVAPAEDELVDEDDIKEEEFLKNPPRKSQKLTTKEYADMIKDHLKAQRIKEALDVLEVRMLKEDRVKPENYVYNLLIDGCAKVGYSKKAFHLFTRMKQRGLKVTGATYTSLFNACANAPWKKENFQMSAHTTQ